MPKPIRVRTVDTRTEATGYAQKEDIDLGMFADELRWNEQALIEIEQELAAIHVAAVRKVKEKRNGPRASD